MPCRNWSFWIIDIYFHLVFTFVNSCKKQLVWSVKLLKTLKIPETTVRNKKAFGGSDHFQLFFRREQRNLTDNKLCCLWLVGLWMRMRLTASLFLTCDLFSEMTPSLFTCEFSFFLFRGIVSTVGAVLSNCREDSESIWKHVHVTQNLPETETEVNIDIHVQQ